MVSKFIHTLPCDCVLRARCGVQPLHSKPPGHSDSSCHRKKDFQHAKTPKEKQIIQKDGIVLQKNKGKSVYVPKSSKDPLTNGTVPLEARHMEIGGPSKFGSNKLIEVLVEAIGAAIKTLADALVNIDLDHNLHNKKDDDMDSTYDESLHPDSPKAARIDLISKNTNILVDSSAATQLKSNGNPDDIAGSAEFEPDSASVSNTVSARAYSQGYNCAEVLRFTPRPSNLLCTTQLSSSPIGIA